MARHLDQSALSSGEADDADLAARELFESINDLFPAKFEELLAIRDELDDFAWRDADIEDYYDEMSFPPFRDRVLAWTEANHVSCDAVNEVAGQIVAGQRIRRTAGRLLEQITVIHHDEETVLYQDSRVETVRPRPFAETKQQFVRRASAVFDKVMADLKRRGFKPRPHKVQVHHFEWLAAHLVSGIPLAAFTREPPTLNGRTLRRGSESAVSEGVRRAASLIGLPLRRKPGPRPGSRAPRRGKRRQ